MKNYDAQSLLTETEDIARAAGVEIMKYYRRHDTRVYMKADGSIVTDADHAAEALVLARLKDLTPDIPVISEEAVERGDRPDIRKGTFWVVDPLDGTAEFEKETGQFAVAIALIQDGRPALGIVYVPVLNIMYSAAGPGTACVTEADGLRKPLSARAPHGRAEVLLNDASVNMDGVGDYLQEQFNTASVAPDRRGTNLRAMDIAAGAADATVVYPKRREGRTKWWDVAPAHAIVEAAGGKIEALDGAPLAYDAADYQVQEHVIKGVERRCARRAASAEMEKSRAP